MSQAKFEEIIENIPKKADELNLNDEKFLFFFKPTIIGEEKFLSLCPIETGMIIFLVIITLQALGSFLYIFKPDSFFNFLIHAILFILYGVSAFYMCLGYTKKKYSHIKVGYIVISVVFIIYAVIYVFKSFIKILKFILPFSGDFLSFNFVEYVFGNGVFLFGYLYLIYILYLYMLNLKKNNSDSKEENNNNIDDNVKIPFNDEIKND